MYSILSTFLFIPACYFYELSGRGQLKKEEQQPILNLKSQNIDTNPIHFLSICAKRILNVNKVLCYFLFDDGIAQLVEHWTADLAARARSPVGEEPSDLMCAFLNVQMESNWAGLSVCNCRHTGKWCEIQKNWCTVTVAPTIEHHCGHSRTPANQRRDQVPGRSQRHLLG